MATEWEMKECYVCNICGKVKKFKIHASQCCGDKDPFKAEYPSCPKCGFMPNDDIEYCPECQKIEKLKLDEWNKLVKGE